MNTNITAQLSNIIQRHTDPEPFSGVVRLRRSGEILFEEGYGLAIRSEKIPNQPNTRFQTASGSKIFTSVAVCNLIEQNRLSLDTRLVDCQNFKFPNFDPNITVKHLLSHTSGITSYFEEDINPDYEILWQDFSNRRH